MKHSMRSLPLAALAIAANAQTNTVVNDPADSSATTIYYTTCPTVATLTTTLPTTLTMCPGQYCNGGYPAYGGYGPPPGYNGAPGAGYAVGGETTVTLPDGEAVVFETVFPQSCETGMYYPTFTVTEPCPCTASRAADYLPSGFSTTVATVLTSACNTCPQTETTVTLTTPCPTGPYASQTTNTGAGAAPTGSAAAGAGANGSNPAGPVATNTAGAGASAPGVGGANGGTAAAYASTGAGSAPAMGASGTSAPNSGYGPGGPGSPGAGARVSGNNSTVSPPISPANGNAAGAAANGVGSAPMSTFTGAAGRLDVFGISGFTLLAGLVGAAAFLL